MMTEEGRREGRKGGREGEWKEKGRKFPFILY
jgi:hypothetical protein